MAKGNVLGKLFDMALEMIEKKAKFCAKGRFPSSMLHW